MVQCVKYTAGKKQVTAVSATYKSSAGMGIS